MRPAWWLGGIRGSKTTASARDFFLVRRPVLTEHDSVTKNATNGGGPGGGPSLTSIVPASYRLDYLVSEFVLVAGEGSLVPLRVI